ncbi:asparagine synthase-related protein [Desulfobacter vibrioformis]|uniref:asparagine synthase-related protein n=1 Tax=Desulfobacter vibrioformis TaxID=34031 RepID=UPI0005581026|nr:asparagine synthase-related protein [Desulfobacter vibrioformis]
MTAIAGVIRLDGPPVEPIWLERMQNILEPYGRDAQHQWHDTQAGLVRTLCRITPEDALDRQPLHDDPGRFALVFDGRIDNRAQLAEKLSISPAQARLMADSGFVLKAYERWGDASVDHLLGDFSLGVWDRRERRLFLARDPLGSRPLYWHRNERFFAFVTLSKGLFALPDVPRQLCEERMADYLALLPTIGPESFYRDIFRIEPGHFLVVENKEVSIRRYHRFDPAHRITFKNDDDYVEAARDLLHESVKCRLRSSGRIASHLSSGLDSSTVAATAAELLGQEGKSLLAFTAVPREGFDGPVPKGRHGDEGPAAAALAARFDNIEHILFRPGGHTPLDGLEAKVERLDRAPLNLCNHVWGDGIQSGAARRGAKVLLTGQMGNMTISYDGRPRLASLLRQGKWLEWMGEARQIVRHTEMRWQGVMAQSLGPFLPVPFWQALNTWKGRGWQSLHDYTAIHPDLIRRTNLFDRARRAGWDTSYRPWADGWNMRTAVLYRMDIGDFFTACTGDSGLEMRDPTADLRLISFCLAIPEDQYLKNGQPRRLLHRLMGHVLPPEILHCSTKGLQAADWYEGATAAREEFSAWLDRLEAGSQSSRYLDLKRMRQLLEAWPQDGWDQHTVIQKYRLLLLRGISVGAFIHHVEGGNR